MIARVRVSVCMCNVGCMCARVSLLHWQPALLYLVPACLLFSLTSAMFTEGGIAAMLKYDEEPDKKELEGKEGDKDKLVDDVIKTVASGDDATSAPVVVKPAALTEVASGFSSPSTDSDVAADDGNVTPSGKSAAGVRRRRRD